MPEQDEPNVAESAATPEEMGKMVAAMAKAKELMRLAEDLAKEGEYVRYGDRLTEGQANLIKGLMLGYIARARSILKGP